MKCAMIFAVLAMLVLSATATPCTDLCNGFCGGSKQTCDLTGILGPLCGIQFNICGLGCSAVCGCVDKCFEQCSTALTNCKAAAGANPLLFANCDAKYISCQGFCGTQCAIETAAGAINQALGGGAAK